MDRSFDPRKYQPPSDSGGGPPEAVPPLTEAADPQALKDASGPAHIVLAPSSPPREVPLPKVLQTFKALAAAETSSPGHFTTAFQIQREYYYLREVPPLEPSPPERAPAYPAWERETKRVFGENFKPDPALFDHQDTAERNRLLAWSCAMQRALHFRLQDPANPVTKELLAEAAKHFSSREAGERAQYADALIALRMFLPEALEQAKELTYRPHLSLDAIIDRLRPAPLREEEQEALWHAYALVQFNQSEQTSGISRFAVLTQMAVKVAEEGGSVTAVLSALFSASSSEQIDSLKSQAVFAPFLEGIAANLDALRQLRTEEYYLPLPRDLKDLSLPSYSRYNDLCRFLQHLGYIAEKAGVKTRGELALLYLVDKLEGLPEKLQDADARTSRDLYHESITLLSQCADQLGFRRLSDSILGTAFAFNDPESRTSIMCAISEALEMSPGRAVRFMKETCDKIEKALLREGIEPQRFRIFFRLKNPLSTYEKWRDRCPDKSLEDAVASFDDLIGFEVRLEHPDEFELGRHVLPAELGQGRDASFYGSWHQEKIDILTESGRLTCEIQMKLGLLEECSYRKRHEPHVLLKDRRRFRQIIGDLLAPRTELIGEVEASFDHIHPPLSGDRNSDFENILSSLTPYALVRVPDHERTRDFDFSACSTIKLPAGSVAVDLLATLFGSRYREYVLLRPGSDSSADTEAQVLRPFDPLVPGETLEFRKARGEEREMYSSPEAIRKIVESVQSLAGIFHLLPADNETMLSRRAEGRRQFENVFGEIDDWLLSNVLKPYCHWKRLQNVDQVFEALGLRNSQGHCLLHSAEVRDWFHQRYVRFEIKDLQDHRIRVAADEDAPGIMREISAIALDLNLLMSEVVTEPSEMNKGAVITLEIDNTAYQDSPDTFEQLYAQMIHRLERIRLIRGDIASQPYGLKHLIHIDLDPGLEAIHHLATLLSGQGESDGKKTKKQPSPNIVSLRIELPNTDPQTAHTVRHVELTIDGPGSSVSDRDVQNRQSFMRDLEERLTQARLPNDKPLCEKVKIEPL